MFLSTSKTRSSHGIVRVCGFDAGVVMFGQIRSLESFLELKNKFIKI